MTLAMIRQLMVQPLEVYVNWHNGKHEKVPYGEDVKHLAKSSPTGLEWVFDSLEALLSQKKLRRTILVLPLRRILGEPFTSLGPQFPLLENEGIKPNCWFSKL